MRGVPPEHPTPSAVQVASGRMARIFITGSSSGLGLNAAHALTDQGHEVVVHARTAGRRPPDPPTAGWAGTVIGDLNDLRQTRQVAEQAQKLGPFDAVIHNAGALHPPDAVPTNVIAPYALTVLMERPSTLIYLSSSMHRGGSTDLSGLVTNSGSYSDSKLWVTALAFALARRWTGTSVHAVDPGWVPTRMGGSSAPDDLDAGHTTQTWLATAGKVTPATGAYWYHQRPQHPSSHATSVDFQEEFLGRLSALTGLALPSE